MKLYDSVGPNPRVVRMFMAEKDISMPAQTVDLRGGENRQAEHLKRNPHGQMPTLELDDGSYLSEITAICEYLEEKNPTPAMIGATPEERAECRMWTRRVDLNIAEPRALIGFAGPRVIQQTVRETLPEGFQRSEFLLEHGALDMIVDRRELRDRIGAMLRLLAGKEPAAA